jgi:hypothetical protein
MSDYKSENVEVAASGMGFVFDPKEAEELIGKKITKLDISYSTIIITLDNGKEIEIGYERGYEDEVDLTMEVR